MTNLPESIWADEGDDRVEYVRADIVTARIAAESEPQWQDGYNSARDDLDAESAHISAREAKLAEIDAHRRKVIAENERQMNALIESSRRIVALEAQLANVKERAKDAASMCEAGYPVSALNVATSTLSALEATPPAPKDPWPVHYANSTAPGRFAPPAPKVTEAMVETEMVRMTVSETIRAMGANPDEQIIGELTVFDAVAVKVRAALTAAQEAGKP